MAEAWSIVDNNFPNLQEDEKTKDTFYRILNYMQVLTEQLKYTLNNLDTSNWNVTALEAEEAKTVGTIPEQIKQLTKSTEQAERALREEMAKKLGKADKLVAVAVMEKRGWRIAEGTESSWDAAPEEREGFTPVGVAGYRLAGSGTQQANVTRCDFSDGQLHMTLYNSGTETNITATAQILYVRSGNG